MIAQHVHQALAQVRELKVRIIEQQRFKGYSGRARMVGGALAVTTALTLNLAFFLDNNWARVTGWGILFILAIIVNYGALVKWFLFDPEVSRDVKKLNPALDLIPSIFVGGILTFAFLQQGQHDLLFGMWMCLFGIMNLISRRVLPGKIVWVGIFYISVGSVLLLIGSDFTNPWPMGITFFLGEFMGGYILENGNV